MGPEAERAANTATAKKAVREIRGEATYMLASILEEDQDHVDYAQVAPLLVGYESNYPMMSAKFQDVVDWRITALDHLGRYDEVNTDVAALVERSKSDTAKQDFVKGLGIEFWKTAQAAKDNNDEKAYLANAKLTATAYKGFAEMAASGKIPVKNLTGTLSIYAQALQATGKDEEADKVFEEVVKADPASPDANAGLARRAQAKGDWKECKRTMDRGREHGRRVRPSLVRSEVPTCCDLLEAGQYCRAHAASWRRRAPSIRPWARTT